MIDEIINRLPSLVDNEVQIWRSWPQPQAYITKLFKDTLTDSEKARADLYCCEKDHDNFVICRALVKLVISRHVKTSPSDIRIQIGPKGKPYVQLPGCQAPFFNVSHTTGMCLIGLSTACPIGVDVELVRDSFRLDVAKSCLSSDEFEALTKMPYSKQLETFFTLWTRKEASVKATGEGLRALMQSSFFCSDEEDMIRPCLRRGRMTVIGLEVGLRHKASLAYHGESQSIAVFDAESFL
jgi:4'-phosphopantetheinyl transferase